MLVISLAIRYMKEDLTGKCRARVSGGLNEQDVLWVLTVPAIWNDAAKQFMREAAAVRLSLPLRSMLNNFGVDAGSAKCFRKLLRKPQQTLAKSNKSSVHVSRYLSKVKPPFDNPSLDLGPYIFLLFYCIITLLRLTLCVLIVVC